MPISGLLKLIRVLSIWSYKEFEADSKEYYSWLNKYLSNEKERPELKLLAKEKF